MAGHVPVLVMSITKNYLLKTLNMAPETYTMMAKEADNVYRWLTQGAYHLKDNCSRKPPYDWSDIREKSKNEAYERIAQSGDAHTSYYWNLAVPTENCSNWIARWFLYHKFRHRDGRNRNPAKEYGSKSSRPKGLTRVSPRRRSLASLAKRSSSRTSRPSGHHSSKHPGTDHFSVTQADVTYYEPQNSYYPYSAKSSSAAYHPQYDQGFKEEDDESPKKYYDPVRDADATRS